ncbi:DUF4252 domain-containing protein [Muricauda sp. JGD-17]|uniref:DUF4252 domain-containing protein n=1 Tax=Flagellimonas ochracea TaxID=2696472 RepID=A0A964TBT3_9FLAO|nr:DUF4252 domain-containing protein [Allomuricauda ochracea]NAY90631.1 DUF4252 domain-containing protein [Allomuricauda ochracea]
MRKWFLFYLLYSMGTVFMVSQTPTNALENNYKVTSTVIGKPMLLVAQRVNINKNNEKDIEFVNLVNQLDSLKVFTTKDRQIVDEISEMVYGYVHNRGFKEYEIDKVYDEDVEFFINGDSDMNVADNLVMFVKERRRISFFWNKQRYTTLTLELYGKNMDLKKLPLLVEKMGLPEELNRIVNLEEK